MGILSDALAKAGYVKREDVEAEIAKDLADITSATEGDAPAEGASGEAANAPASPTQDATPANETPAEKPTQPRNERGQFVAQDTNIQRSPAAPPANAQVAPLPDFDNPKSMDDLGAIADNVAASHTHFSSQDRSQFRKLYREGKINRIVDGVEITRGG